MMFEAKRCVKKAVIHLNGSPDTIFPLLCPVREYEWLDGWRCEMIFSESGYMEKDCVFSTYFNDIEGTDVWYVAGYEPDTFLCMIRINAISTIRFEIVLSKKPDGTTQSTWTQTITALNERGNTFIDNMTDEMYADQIHLREKEINHFLLSGTMLRDMKNI
jgi:hypothetical protein